MDISIEKLKYPIGKPNIPDEILPAHISDWIAILAQFPERLNNLVSNLSAAQLNTPYRPGGWTIRQVIHHLSDSHHNSYTRFKWTLTENNPVIKTYDEKKWAELFDSTHGPIALSLEAISALHAKWVYVLRGLDMSELSKYFIHPDGNEKVSLKENIGIYAWHCNHHYAQIAQLIEREGW